jgi:serine/threonine protein kinase
MVVVEDIDIVVEKFRQFQHEVCMMSLVSHPNLVRLFGVMIQPRPRIVMEFCPLPDLSQLLYDKNKKNMLSYSQKIAIGFDIASALA